MSERHQAETDDRTRRRDLEGVEERWRRWARRPPRTSPETAAHRVLARLAEPDPQPGWQPAGGWTSRSARRLVAAALALAAVGIWLLTAGPPWPLPAPDTDPGPGTESDESPSAAVRSVEVPEAPTMAEGVVLMWLDAETPLYMTLAPPGRAAGVEKGEGS